MDTLEEDGTYDYRNLEKILGEGITWLLLNALVKSDTIEYGTSIRFGWLTLKGGELRDFIKDKSIEELYEIIMDDDQ